MDNPVVLGLCGGFHDPRDTEGVLDLWAKDPALSAIPAFALGTEAPWAPLSAHTLRQSLDHSLQPSLGSAAFPSPNSLPSPGPPQGQDLILWAFSAGGVGAAALAHHWHRYRGTVRAIFLVDGWGVPWAGEMPLHRLSHDAFTHHSSRLLGAGRADFFAHPAVPHRQLWRSPQTVVGLGELPPNAAPPAPSQPLNAADFLTQWTRFYALPSLAAGQAS